MKTVRIANIRTHRALTLSVLMVVCFCGFGNNLINNNKNDNVMKHTLKSLPYAMDALEPIISKLTMEFHYGKHHQTYVNNLNNLIVGTEFEEMELEEIVKKASGGIYNNAAQDFNHTFFWESMSPAKENNVPTGALAKAIDEQWGSFEAFYDAFAKSATTLFGSGWTWLVVNKDGKLEIVAAANAGCPIRDGQKPLLVVDVWEHAYYLDKQNRRADFVLEFKKLIDWDKVSDRFGK